MVSVILVCADTTQHMRIQSRPCANATYNAQKKNRVCACNRASAYKKDGASESERAEAKCCRQPTAQPSLSWAVAVQQHMPALLSHSLFVRARIFSIIIEHIPTYRGSWQLAGDVPLQCSANDIRSRAVPQCSV